MRAGDADRERVAERLRIALEEGRLNLQEYDERLREAYAAKTYAELDKLLVDLPGVTPISRSQVAVPGQPDPDGRYPGAARRWLAETWAGWTRIVAICTGIWAVTAVLSGELTYFWPVWVAAPWGVLLLVQTFSGMVNGEPQRWAAKQARKEAEREVRRQARRGEDGC
ncbi:MAG: DUF1707 domain-containing protein [Micromonosporaceae bacterium]|nr:DUF1707 domain-containing protein [Micromonosporaceae bacterium]